jgi:hypothetical protein
VLERNQKRRVDEQIGGANGGKQEGPVEHLWNYPNDCGHISVGCLRDFAFRAEVAGYGTAILALPSDRDHTGFSPSTTPVFQRKINVIK